MGSSIGNVHIWPGLPERLIQAAREAEYGWISGIVFPESIALLGCARCVDGDQSLLVDLGQFSSMLLSGVEVVGAYAKMQGGDSKAALTTLQSRTTLLRSASELQHFIAALVGTQEVHFYRISEDAAEQMTPASIDAETSAGHWLEQHFSFLNCHLLVSVEAYGSRSLPGVNGRATAVPLSKAVSAAFQELSDNLTGQGSTFVLSGGSLSPDKRLLCGSPNGAYLSCEDLKGTLTRPMEASCFCQRDHASKGTPTTVPVLEYQPVEGGSVSLDRATADLAVLCLAPKDTQLAALADLLRQAVRKQLQAMEACMLAQGRMCDLRALHFQPPGWAHPITLIYPWPAGSGKSTESAEEGLLPLRQQLHRRLCLPADRPLLRVANALTFKPQEGSSAEGQGQATSSGRPKRLPNVHVGLQPSGVRGGTMHIIDGSYDYYHYMQDNFDDSGWGCAYRSLQTICSWFVKQHYTSMPAPSHQQMQQILVDIGDKPRNFVGSKQWIGAIELGFILDTLLGVACRVMTVPSGADMPGKAREIAHHFDTEGTPIMIGGGVLAYTLLGIDYNEHTGECAFLILDPHYTGSDDLKAIHKGQWVAWKFADGKAAAGGELFVKTAFYNLLCPLRPRLV